jgi:hypothetical protein
MISVKNCTNLESFNQFGRGSQMDLARSHGYTHGELQHKFSSNFLYLLLQEERTINKAFIM